MYKILTRLDKLLPFKVAQAHCDIPCKIYDPISAQLAGLTVIRLLDLIAELEDQATLSASQQATLSRLIAEKETHAEKVKHEVRIIWGDYFKQPQFEKFPETNELVHKIMLKGSACKQHTNQENGLELLELLNQFATIFWTTKGVDVYTSQCPYPPSKEVVYPKLNES